MEAEADDAVKEYSWQQRAAGPGEPRCVVCGRYGEYVCEATDADVCSRDCKRRNTVAVAANSTERYVYTPLPTSGADQDRAAHGMDVQGPTDECGAERWLGDHVPSPISTFEALQLPRPIAANLAALGFAAPTPIQMQTVPAALLGRDVLAGAATGTGKTLAYALAIVCRLWAPTPAPDQIERLFKQLVAGLPHMRTALVVGGEPAAPQLHRLRSGVQIIVATPGRLHGLCRAHADVAEILRSVPVVVLDEVDQMLEHGLESQVRELLGRLPASRQTLAFSATIPPRTELAALSMLTRPVLVAVGDVGSVAANVFQTILWVEETAKKHKLFALLTEPKYYRPPVLVFVNSRVGAELLVHAIHVKCRLAARALHGDMVQTDRVEALTDFIAGQAPVLVATAVLGRGLDLPNVATVILFDMSETVEDYVHQVGRAARGSQPGWAITFLNGQSSALFPDLIRVVQHLSVPGRVSPLPPQLQAAAAAMVAAAERR